MARPNRAGPLRCPAGASVAGFSWSLFLPRDAGTPTGCLFTNNIGPCDDGSARTTADACGGGASPRGAPAVCSDGNMCTDDA